MEVQFIGQAVHIREKLLHVVLVKQIAFAGIDLPLKCLRISTTAAKLKKP